MDTCEHPPESRQYLGGELPPEDGMPLRWAWSITCTECGEQLAWGWDPVRRAS